VLSFVPHLFSVLAAREHAEHTFCLHCLIRASTHSPPYNKCYRYSTSQRRSQQTPPWQADHTTHSTSSSCDFACDSFKPLHHSKNIRGRRLEARTPFWIEGAEIERSANSCRRKHRRRVGHQNHTSQTHIVSVV
jgi:hypothetical protein